MKYYYVSYSCTTASPPNLMFGCAEISGDHDITNISHIQKIQEWIENDLTKQGFQNPAVCVINYTLLREE